MLPGLWYSLRDGEAASVPTALVDSESHDLYPKLIPDSLLSENYRTEEGLNH